MTYVAPPIPVPTKRAGCVKSYFIVSESNPDHIAPIPTIIPPTVYKVWALDCLFAIFFSVYNKWSLKAYKSMQNSPIASSQA
jgi:hypothetical protein